MKPTMTCLGPRRIIIAVLFVSCPFVIPSMTKLLLPYARKTAIYIGYIYRLHRWPLILRPPDFRTYASLEEEERYWRSAARHRRRLESSDARYGGKQRELNVSIPLVTYYSPRLLPAYRVSSKPDNDAAEYCLSARVFCKWHRMVFRGPLHPTLIDADKLMKRYSNRDRREIYRISRMVSDEQVARWTSGDGRSRWTPKYQNIWKKWLESKGPDIAIVFE